MKTTSDFCVSMTPKWDFNVHEAAQSSFRSAHHLFSCISGQKHGTSIELTLMTENAIAEFRKLLSLMDGPPLYSRRIRKGPLPNLININPRHLLENQSSPTTPCVNPISFSLPHTQFMQLYDLQRKPSNNFQLYQQEQHSATLHHCYSETEASVQKNSFLQFDSCITQSSSTVPSRQSLFASSISLDGSSTGKPMIQYSLSMQSTRDDCSMFSTKMKFVGKNNVESRKRSASTGGCHCSKQRKLRIKRTIRVPAVSSKLADIPSDDFSWRKYGQKPIKGSPHPRSYYKCSSMRGCPARKHVERCLRDSTMLIVTYEGDHSHPRATFPVPDNVIQQ